MPRQQSLLLVLHSQDVYKSDQYLPQSEPFQNPLAICNHSFLFIQSASEESEEAKLDTLVLLKGYYE
ncbi:hypothetical protein CEP53_004862 [Fusarium sp. AF-6]|nr:hypothetical protein CEP53_004862 [Fusarium sp. AF-6]